MSLLPYCIVSSGDAGLLPKTGVAGHEIRSFEESGLAVGYSQIEKTEISAELFQQNALEFHNAVHVVFGRVAVVPFRFPTWLSEPELRRHMREHSLRYRSFLQLHRSQVQMEIRIHVVRQNEMADSGTQHLRARALELRSMDATASTVKKSLANEAIEWRQREIPEGLRLFALVERDHIAPFREAIARLDANLRCSGPWPATEFLDQAANSGSG
jgi:hypothetical protein